MGYSQNEVKDHLFYAVLKILSSLTASLKHVRIHNQVFFKPLGELF